MLDETHRVVERLAKNRHARMAGLEERREEIAEAGVDRHCLDVGARDHDVVDAGLAQAEDVVQHRPLFRREAALVLGGKRLGDFLAEVAGVLQSESGAELVEPRLHRRTGGLGCRVGRLRA
jgi:hypothetical protein